MRTHVWAIFAIFSSSVMLSACAGGDVSPPPAAGAAQNAAKSTSSVSFNYSTHPRVRSLGDLFLSNCTTSTQCATPTTIRTGYSFPSTATGAGKTIMIVDAFGSPTIVDDVNRFSKDFGLPAMTLGGNLKIFYPGGKPTFNANQAADVSWAEETSLDVEWTHAAAPAATIALIVAPNDQGQSIQSAQQYAVQTVKGSVLALSFGVQESSINGGANNTQLQQAEQIYLQAKAQNVTVIASAGDLGATGAFTSANAQFPASSPYVLAVGGTNLILFHNDNYRNESVWNDGDNCLAPCNLGASGATGGAPSILFPAPAWQKASLAAYNTRFPAFPTNARSTSDVSYNASPNTGVAVYLGFASQVKGLGPNGYYAVGGTSQGPPQWAGIIAAADALRGSDLGCVNADLYALAAVTTKTPAFHDVTSGDNIFPSGATGYTAAPNWDPPTGLGSPDATNLINVLSSPSFATTSC